MPQLHTHSMWVYARTLLVFQKFVNGKVQDIAHSKVSHTKTNVSLKRMKIIFHPTNSVPVWLIWGRRMLCTERFDLDLRMIELWAKIGTLHNGTKRGHYLGLALIRKWNALIDPKWRRKKKVIIPKTVLVASQHSAATGFNFRTNEPNFIFGLMNPFWFSD